MNRLHGTWLAALLLSVPVAAQRTSFSTAESMELRGRSQESAQDPEPGLADGDGLRAPAVERREEVGPPRALELALSSQAYWLGLRLPLRGGIGHFELGLLGDEDDDLALSARLLRYGRPLPDSRWTLGVGVSGYLATFDVPANADAFALGLTGSASYDFPTSWPTNLGAELTFAPDVTTWSDGEDLLDLRLRAEVELSPFAAAFVGYRRLEVDLGGDGEAVVDDRLQVGVRLSF